jgi:hypothetical protein
LKSWGVIIMTDGLENASKVFTTPQVLDLIVQQRDIYRWDFVYLGANQDAIATAAKMGIAAASAMPYAANSAATTNVREAVRLYSGNIVHGRSFAANPQVAGMMTEIPRCRGNANSTT